MDIDRIFADLMAGEELSAEDRVFLEEWQRISGENGRFGDEMGELKDSRVGLKWRASRERVFLDIKRGVKHRRARSRFVKCFSVAVAILLLLGVTCYFIFYRERPGVKMELLSSNITPGCPRAELELPGGKVIPLDSCTRGVVVDSQMELSNRQNTLIYQLGRETGETEYHTIHVPRGGEYNLQLSDNTRVYLNAGSSLRYPVRFNDDMREVFLTGEAYFEVMRDSSRAFIVRAGEIAVQVLGTSFNVNAYSDREEIATTLVEGRVRIDCGGKECLLIPGTQLVYHRDRGDAEVRAVDTEVYTSWKDGYYYFRRETLENIMDKLARWYDMNVFYESSELKALEFGGRLRKYDRIGYLLDRMEATEDVAFVVNGNTITVKRK